MNYERPKDYYKFTYAINIAVLERHSWQRVVAIELGGSEVLARERVDDIEPGGCWFSSRGRLAGERWASALVGDDMKPTRLKAARQKQRRKRYVFARRPREQGRCL